MWVEHPRSSSLSLDDYVSVVSVDPGPEVKSGHVVNMFISAALISVHYCLYSNLVLICQTLQMNGKLIYMVYLEKPGVETLLPQIPKLIECYKVELHRKPESKTLRNDHKRSNREPEFSTIQLNQQPLS